MHRSDYLNSLFRGVDQRASFQAQERLFPIRRHPASSAPKPFPCGARVALPTTYAHEGLDKDVQQFLTETGTMAMLVLKEGEIRHESYAHWGGRDAHWLSMSVAKSFVATLVGIALDEGHFGSVEDPVTEYVPALAGSGYDGVRIKDILQMSSGVAFDEDYSNPDCDFMALMRCMEGDGSFDAFAATLVREREPGTFNHYVSVDTQVLGMLLANVTGRSVSDYMQEKLWEPLGMERDGFWICDPQGVEMSYAGLNMVARDYAKLGELYRLKGLWHGKQIVPAAWIEAAVTADAPHLEPGDIGLSDMEFGYGYQWWLFDGDEGEYCAIGVYNQLVYVNPTRGTVIVKLSANPDYGRTGEESSYREAETLELFRAINKTLEI